MTSPLPAPLPRSALVARLRAAGCVFAEDEADLLISTAGSPHELATMAGRRTAGEPLEHVLGWAGFCGMRTAVEAGVFVPRRRTEFLVRQAAEALRAVAGRCREAAAAPVLVDLCCGSGAVGAALASQADGRVELHAGDVDPAAVRCARHNLAAYGGHVHHGDLYEPLPAGLRGRVDVLVANVPYVPADEVPLLPPEARLHEPRVALDGGPDGLDVLRRVAAGAPGWLAPGGSLLVETSERQAPRALEAVAGGGLAARAVTCEEFDATVITAARPDAGPA
jgi:release factor glutamine methyltransferase